MLGSTSRCLRYSASLRPGRSPLRCNHCSAIPVSLCLRHCVRTQSGENRRRSCPDPQPTLRTGRQAFLGKSSRYCSPVRSRSHFLSHNARSSLSLLLRSSCPVSVLVAALVTLPMRCATRPEPPSNPSTTTAQRAPFPPPHPASLPIAGGISLPGLHHCALLVSWSQPILTHVLLLADPLPARRRP